MSRAQLLALWTDAPDVERLLDVAVELGELEQERGVV